MGSWRRSLPQADDSVVGSGTTAELSAWEKWGSTRIPLPSVQPMSQQYLASDMQNVRPRWAKVTRRVTIFCTGEPSRARTSRRPRILEVVSTRVEHWAAPVEIVGVGSKPFAGRSLGVRSGATAGEKIPGGDEIWIPAGGGDPFLKRSERSPADWPRTGAGEHFPSRSSPVEERPWWQALTMESWRRSLSEADDSVVDSGTTAELSAWEKCGLTGISIAERSTDVTAIPCIRHSECSHAVGQVDPPGHHLLSRRVGTHSIDRGREVDPPRIRRRMPSENPVRTLSLTGRDAKGGTGTEERGGSPRRHEGTKKEATRRLCGIRSGLRSGLFH
jgi:hypothetical protein